MSIPLEDNWSDILEKAMKGRGVSESTLAQAAGVSLESIQNVLNGNFDLTTVGLICEHLDLQPARLAYMVQENWKPEPVDVAGLLSFNTAYGPYTVNAYLVFDPKTLEAAAFDTGSDSMPMVDAANRLGLQLKSVFITHAHADHVFDLERLLEKTGAEAWTPIGEPVHGASPFEPGQIFSIGGLSVETRLTCGHAPGGVTYVVRGLDRLVAICGDAVFAGSMGGGKVSYQDALRTNREQIYSLQNDTVICPGHGPLTTVGEEKSHNPFY